MRARVVAILVGLGLALHLITSTDARAEERPRLTLDVRSSCPSQALVTAELAPLLRQYELTSEPSAVVARIDDLGASYRVAIGAASREVSDTERRCLDRARVAAVFLALNLPQFEAPKPAPRPAPLPPAVPAVAPTPRSAPTPSPLRARRALALRAFVQVEVTPPSDVSSRGAGGGLSAELGAFSISLLSAVTTPTRPYQPQGEPPRFELRRLPFAALVGWEKAWGMAGVGAEAGLALDLLSFQGETVPNPERAFRVNAGLRANGAFRVYASRRWQAELLPGFSFFPRTYIVRVEPASTLAETPEWWLGFSLGLRYSVWEK